MKLKLDENLGSRGAELFREEGHDVATVPEENIFGAGDSDLIAVCKSENRCLVTLDLDFGNPLLFPPGEYSGIAVLRLPAEFTPSDLEKSMRTLLAALEHSDIVGKLWIVQRRRIREYAGEDE